MSNPTKIIVLCGLPGSGKTTKAKELKSNIERAFPNYRGNYRGDEAVRIWNFDSYMGEYQNPLDIFFKDINARFHNHRVHILDGLFIRQHHYQRIINEFEFRNVEFEFHYFEYDIESCLWNDKYRRDIDSTITLEIALYEYPDLEKLNYGNKSVKLFQYPITLKSTLQMFLHKYSIGYEETLTSSSWTTGGNWRDCWGDGGEYSEQDQPEEFDELNYILEKIDPNISPNLCQEIKDLLATVEEDSEGDWYGGVKYYAYYTISLQSLFEHLHEIGMIDKNNL